MPIMRLITIDYFNRLTALIYIYIYNIFSILEKKSQTALIYISYILGFKNGKPNRKREKNYRKCQALLCTMLLEIAVYLVLKALCCETSECKVVQFTRGNMKYAVLSYRAILSGLHAVNI